MESRMTYSDIKLEDILKMNLVWRLDLAPDGKFIQILNAENVLVAGINKDYPKVSNLLVTAPRLVDALSQAVIILSHPELYPQNGQMTLAYCLSVLKQCVGEIH